MRRGRAIPFLPFLFALLTSGSAGAATFSVANLADSGAGSLRQAVLDANSAAGADEVVFAPGVVGTITLTSGQIAITDSLVVHGPGFRFLTVSGNDLFRIFRVERPAVDAPIDVTLAGLTLTQGNSLPELPDTPGGAVLGLGENLWILDCVVSDSRSSAGGGIAFYSFSGAALLTIESSTIAGNSAAGGGGLSTFGSVVRILNSTFSGNSVSGDGGALYSEEGNLEIVNSTLSGNQAQRFGGAISGRGTILLRSTTVTENTADVRGGGITFETFLVNGFPALDHAIVGNNAPDDLTYTGMIPGGLESNYSLIEAPGGVGLFGAHNLVGADPLLGPLADNGGPTLTHALLPGSPARDAGNPAIPNPPATDQRGSVRILGAAIDLGSVEGGTFVEVPTLSQIGLLLFGALLLAAGLRRMRRTGTVPF